MAETLAAAREPHKLDELMLAMDVVDTLRHGEALVNRELNAEQREADLLRRLRDIYRGQGIEVPDRVLQEGVRALEERRFAYAPPPPGVATTLARMWVGRGRIGKGLLAAAAALGIGWGAYHVGIALPARERAEQARLAQERARIDITQRLPLALEQAHEDARREAQVAAARERADSLLADGKAALARENAAAAQQAIGDLEVLRASLRREYTLRVVSRPGEPSGVWRVPQRNPAGRNYYLIVEAVTPDGRTLTLPVTGEEDGRTETVSKWGVRVSEEVFDQIRRDKNDDGIVQQNRLGEKRRGRLEPDYLMPVLGGAITRW
ncbi:MAG TPA: DUF6384 family protein [Beijerinckiaceae bacterium]